MIAPAAPPNPAPPRVPFSRVESGCPEHPTRRIAAAAAPMGNAVVLSRISGLLNSIDEEAADSLRSLGLAGLLEALDLLTLLLDLLLLLFNLSLGLLLLVFLVLESVADRIAANTSDRTADGGTGAGSADGSPDDRAGRGADPCAPKGPLFPGGKGFTGTGRRKEQRGQRQRASGDLSIKHN